MANTMRWRYGDTCPVMLPVDSATVIEIGDLLYLDTDDAKPAGLPADQGTEGGESAVVSRHVRGRGDAGFGGGDTQPIRVATTRRVRVRLREHDARSRRHDGRR